ncbi:MAG: EpsG family protein [Floccifex sp.]
MSVQKACLLSLYMAFFLAIRQVPGDNIQYEEAYRGLYIREYEAGWAFLISVCKKLNFSLVAYKCFAIYFLHIFFFLSALRKEWYPYLSLFILFYCLIGIESSSNIMRHWMAACIVLVGYRFYQLEYCLWKKLLMYCICVFLATQFHTSAYFSLLAPIIMFINNPSYKVQIIIYIIAFTSGRYFMDAWEYASIFLNSEDFVYNFYFNQYDVNKVDTTTGLGQIYYVVESSIIAYMYQKKVIANTMVQSSNLYYKLYFWGMVLFFLTCGFQDMARLSLYFSIVQIIIIALFVHHGLNKTGIVKAMAIFIIVMRLALFVRTTLADEIYGITPIKYLI